MDSVELIKIHLELECIGVNKSSQLHQIPCADPDDLPRFYIAHHDKGYSRYFRQDLAVSICNQLLALAPETALRAREIVQTILAQDTPCTDIHTGKSYVFPDLTESNIESQAVRLDESHRALIEQFSPDMNIVDKAVFAVIIEGRIVSICESSRENARAGEVWVQTVPDFRGRGFAGQVTAAWARHLQQQTKIPFYSHKLSNLASQAVAQQLNLIQYIQDAVYV